MAKFQTALILPDVHVPWHNVALLKRIMRLMDDVKVHQLVIAGDFLDLYSLSRWHKDSLYHLKNINLSFEYEAGGQVIDALMGHCRPGVRGAYLYGNHEDNYLRWLQEGDNAKVGSELGSPEEAMYLRERGWQVFTDWKNDRVTLGAHLEIAHGEAICVHAAKKHLDEHEGSVLFGHTHRFQSFVTGKRGAYNIGWLGDPDAPGFRYASRAQRQKWVNGFALVHILDDGSFLPQPIQCWNNRFVCNGKLY